MPTAPICESDCQAIVYAESGTVEIVKAGTADTLAAARGFIAAVAYKRSGQGLAKPVYPSAAELQQPAIKQAWNACLKAAQDAKGDDVKACQHFVIWHSDDGGKTPSSNPKWPKADSWPYDHEDKINTVCGPFKANNLGGKADLYVFKYCGVP